MLGHSHSHTPHTCTHTHMHTHAFFFLSLFVSFLPVHVAVLSANYRDVTTATGNDAMFPLGPYDRFGKKLY